MSQEVYRFKTFPKLNNLILELYCPLTEKKRYCSYKHVYICTWHISKNTLKIKMLKGTMFELGSIELGADALCLLQPCDMPCDLSNERIHAWPFQTMYLQTLWKESDTSQTKVLLLCWGLLQNEAGFMLHRIGYHNPVRAWDLGYTRI